MTCLRDPVTIGTKDNAFFLPKGREEREFDNMIIILYLYIICFCSLTYSSPILCAKMAVQLSQLSHHTSQRVRHPVSIGLRNKIQRKLQRIFHFHEHKTPVPCAIGFLWTGFYRVMPKGGSPEGSGQELVLVPCN